MRRALTLALASSLALGLALVGAACEGKSGGQSPLRERTDEPTAEALSKWIDLWIPPSASGYRSHAESWQEWTVLATFELPAAELPGFLERNRLVVGPSAAPPPSKQPWFQPPAEVRRYTQAPPSSEAEAAAAKPSRFAKVVWLSEQEGRARVYLRANDS